MKSKYRVLSLAFSLLRGMAVMKKKLSEFADSEGLVFNPDWILYIVSKHNKLLHRRIALCRISLTPPKSKHLLTLPIFQRIS